VLTQGGPGATTKSLVYYIYEAAFTQLRMGYASSMSVALFLIIFVFSLLNIKLNKNSGGLL